MVGKHEGITCDRFEARSGVGGGWKGAGGGAVVEATAELDLRRGDDRWKSGKGPGRMRGGKMVEAWKAGDLVAGVRWIWPVKLRRSGGLLAQELEEQKENEREKEMAGRTTGQWRAVRGGSWCS